MSGATTPAPSPRAAARRSLGPWPTAGAATVLAAALLAGCAAGPGASPSPTPPQLVMTEAGLKRWDRPEAFGPVPPAELARARQYCATLNHSGKRFVPSGFHPHALSVEGFPFEDGGFYCVQQ
ncbi:MAG: hypothetical protein M9919_04980 [Burkholderiaceae bacterium]|jgi:hypothetical protein|nr:hypothetical protein [Burkholderiaceae bacterium]MCO5103342.1 hypothetical protein [Burkholderiaceae bacterium]